MPSSRPPLSRASAIDPRSAPGACVPGPGVFEENAFQEVKAFVIAFQRPTQVCAEDTAVGSAQQGEMSPAKAVGRAPALVGASLISVARFAITFRMSRFVFAFACGVGVGGGGWGGGICAVSAHPHI